MIAETEFTPEPAIKAGDIAERCGWDDGTIWVRKWIMESPGLLHLVWAIERKGSSWSR